MGVLKAMIWWVAIATALAPIWGAFLWDVMEGIIRPLLIPQAEIEALCAALLAAHGQSAEEIAFLAEDRAWRYSDSFEQGKWHRVRREIARRLNKLDRDQACLPLPPSAT